MTHAPPPDWWQSLYDDIVADLFLVRKDKAELQATVAFLMDQLKLSAGTCLFDQCCGIGSLSLPLARAGVQVRGVDQAARYIERAWRQAQAEGLSCQFHVGDAFDFQLDQAVDAALNWGTSFGNADDPRNLQMLCRAFQSLRPGGRFALDVLNVPRLLRHFQPYLCHQSNEHGETLLVRESTLDLAGGSLRQRWLFVLPDGSRQVRQSAIRLYLPHHLAGMLQTCGFADITFHGGVRGEPLGLDSHRCILIARRPA
jgi:2-polyprenyl-3-methyl-5-hydroxy-6-metoxy-1,4-benzoquinol methylase